MPIYEYQCKPCELTFETLIRTSSDTPHCPKCGGVQLAKQFSVPAAAQTAGPRGSSLPVCNTGSADYGCGPDACRTGMCSFD